MPEIDRREPLCYRRWLLLIGLTAFVTRAGWGVFRCVQMGGVQLEFPDEQQYWQMAASFMRGDGLRDELGFLATRMPLFPAFLSLFVELPGGRALAKIAHWIIGSVVAVLAARLALDSARCALRTPDSGFSMRVGLVAGLIVAFDPFLIFFSSLLLTETTFIAALLGLMILVGSTLSPRLRQPLDDGRGAETPPSMRKWFAIGACAALCVYLRESSLGLVLLLIGLSVVAPGFSVARMKGGVLAALIVFAALVPWAGRNRGVIGEWVFLTTRGGISLYDGVGPHATGASDLGDVKQSPEVAGLTELEWHRHFLAESFRAIREDPGRVLRLAIVKFRRTWSPVPNAEDYRSGVFQWVAAGWMIPIYGLAVVGVVVLIRGGRNVAISIHATTGTKVVLLLLLPAIYFTILHCVFVGSVRYRLPAMPMIEILAAVAVAAWWVRPAKSVECGTRPR